MNGRVILWLLVAASCNAARVAALPRQSPGNAEGKQQLEKTDNMARKMRYWFEPVKGLKVDMDSNELLVKYSPYKNLESRDGGVSVAGGVSGEKQHKKGKKDKGKTKDKPTMMQKLGTFMMMIPVTMQFMQMPMAIASIKMQLLRSILVGKLALFILFLRTLLTNRQVKEKIVVVRTPPKEVHEHFYHPFEDPEDNKPGWLGKPPAWME